ncbi:MAG: cob(I)yrinic acid a,c-diamide adenosyltransferase [Candidatus Gracilibacteria bacterium]
MKITTKMGDCGETKLLNGKKVLKNDFVVCAIGEIDELNSFLGWTKAGVNQKDVFEVSAFDYLEKFQDALYGIMGNTGTAARDFEYLEGILEKYEKFTGSLKGFKRPGDGEFSGRLHVARSVCRRAERAFLGARGDFEKNGWSEKNLGISLKYLNRLSDALFLMAIFHEKG